MSQNTAFATNLTHLLDARILSFRVGGGEPEFVTADEVDRIEFRVRSEEAFLHDEHVVNLLLRITADGYGNTGSEKPREFPELGAFIIGFSFLVDNYDDLVQPPTEAQPLVVADFTLMTHLFAMAYATARGMILVKSLGTSLEGGILPIINPQELMAKESD